MKKNKFLRAASGLLIATLISTCAISGTYAKYVTEGSVNDTARVADFGVVINAGGTLYSSAYYEASTTGTAGTGNQPAASTVTAGVEAGTATVKAANATDNLVAPGTESYGNGLSFGVTGTPEVSVTIAAEITAEDIFLGEGTWAVMTETDFDVTADNFSSIIAATPLYTEDNGTYTAADTFSSTDTYYYITDSATATVDYYPVKYSLDGTTTYSGNVTTASAQAVADLVATAIDSAATSSSTVDYKAIYSISKKYAANTDLDSDLGLGGLTLSWVWDYSTSATLDAQDTILGDLIAQKNNSGTLDDGSVVVYTEDPDNGYTAVTFNDYEVLYGTEVVAYLQTSFAIELSVTQID